MSSEIVRAPLRRFITSPIPEVLALKGRWGVGKTFFWNGLVREESSARSIHPKKYAYVSLFGIDSLEQLKSAIFEQTVSALDVSRDVTVQSLKQNITGFFTQWGDDNPSEGDRQGFGSKWFGRMFHRGASVAALLPQTAAYGALVRAASFMMVRDTLICIDDFERKGSGLDAREILGLVSFLREQRNCKVALIFNDGSLDKETAEQYAKFREKVVDIEVAFSPSVEEAVEIVFDRADPYHAQILERAKLLNLTNIRILQKIKRLLDVLSPHLANRHAGTVQTVVISIVLLSWGFFSGETDGPTLEYIKGLDSAFMIWAPKKKKGPFDTEKASEAVDPTERWNQLLKSYGWSWTDELDKLLAETIERGYPNGEALKVQLDARDADLTVSSAKAEVEEVWRMFHGSFEANDAQFISNMISVANRNARHLSRGDLNAVYRVLKDLNQETEARKIVDQFVDANKDRPEMFTLETFIPGEEAVEPYIQKRFFEMEGLTKVPQQMGDVVRRIAGDQGWGGADEVFLIERSEDEFYEYLKSENSVALHSCVRGLLRFGQFGNATDAQKGIAEKTKKALQKIASESPLNALRVRRHGI